ncbi:MAG: hypothetical protein E3J83_03310 [Candidatus Atribacteria bacterium]|nr:MAG: hypothetical protein E3J83_03310 [Candidatus Atribacteria bacterium]
MKLSNVHNIPQAMVNALSDFQEPKKDILRVSELIGAPKQKKLRIKYWAFIEEDVSERLWSLLGQSVHYILEKGAPENAFKEERLMYKIDGVVISGQSDLWCNEEIGDYKTTSVFSFLLGIKPDWVAQLNVYKWLWEKNGFKTKSLKIHAILRDWIRSKAMLEPKYPQIPFITVDIPMWTMEETEKYIRRRIALHKLPIAPLCTEEEKWTRPTTYAITEKGAKRARRVCTTLAEAKMWMKDNSKWYIVADKERKTNREPFAIMKHGLVKPKASFKTLEEAELYIRDNETLEIDIRKGKNVRCEGYCNVAKWCNKK